MLSLHVCEMKHVRHKPHVLSPRDNDMLIYALGSRQPKKQRRRVALLGAASQH